MNARAAYILFNMMEGIGPVRVRSLIEALGSIEALLDADAEQLMRGRAVGRELARSIIEQRQRLDPDEEERRAEKKGFRLITFIDPEYPEPLKQIYDPPLALYVWGTLEARDAHSLALIGSRRTTSYGRRVTDRLSHQLSLAGFCIISGLARGIDTAAHEAALRANGRTLAVLGGALDKLYPAENRLLAEKIAAQGAVISEFPLGREPDRTTFPMRNRIVSGLSMGVVVVEAGYKSGALHTADAALEQGRSVFAVPGRIDESGSRGAHRLIKNGAKLVEDVDDVLQEFELLIPPEKQAAGRELPRQPEVQLSANEQRVVEVLWDGEKDVDTLARALALPAAQVSAMLVGLEMKRVVRMLPGRLVELALGWKEKV
jgi:DNA processing protein